jgi:hypothetical protein
MNTTALIRPPAAAGRAAQRSDAGYDASPSASERRTFGEVFAELVPLVGAVPGEGPPVIFVAGPWLLLVLMLSGPFAFLVVLVIFMVVAATVLVALAAAILAILRAPHLLFRRLRRHRAPQALSDDHAAHLVPVESPRVVA